MSFQVSPGVVTKEFDVTTIVPQVDASVAAIAGVMRWGPVGQTRLVDSEALLVATYGKPTNLNAETWFSAASFLAYSSALIVSRAANTSTSNGAQSALTAIGNTAAISANLNLQVVKNSDHYVTKDGTFDASVLYVGKYPGAMGNSLRLSVIDAANQFTSTISLSGLGTGAILTLPVGSNAAVITINAASNTLAQAAANSLVNSIGATDVLQLGNSSIGTQYIKVSQIDFVPANNVTGNTTTGTAVVTIELDDQLKLHTNVTMSSTLSRFWEFWDLVDQAPGQSAWMAAYGNTSANDELHAVLVDDGGKFTGVPGTVLEVYKGLSRARDAKTSDNSTNYYKDAINTQSPYIWWANDRPNAVSNTGLNLTSATTTAVMSLSFNSGADGPDEANVIIADLAQAYDMFADDAAIADVGLVIAGKARGGSAGGQMANYIIDNICEVRKDCVVFVSPDRADVVNNVGLEAQNIVDFRNTLRNSSYFFLDSGYKYMYDRYNDVYRYVPLNGDMAGLAARTDATNDAWWSPAGFNRGQVKNLVRLAWNPRKTYRDLLYKNGANPVVTFDGLGTVLYGDKTGLTKPSAFDRINVRRLFIVLEKAISTAAKYSLFEFNDAFTRSQFRNMVNPYLRDIKGRRGVTDFLVICDETNNPGVVVDRNEFVGSILVKPARSINFITLNFVAVGTDVSFTEAVGFG